MKLLGYLFGHLYIRLQNWRTTDDASTLGGPILVQATFEITGTPGDTFLDMTPWHRGIVFVNGFNIGRYFRAGPQQTLYVPSPLLQTGTNTVGILSSSKH
jgi:beta-galactosidase